MNNSQPPVTPYPGADGYTAGSAGSEASAERAQRDVTDGTAQHRQDLLLAALDKAGHDGLTIKDARAMFPTLHHGQISSTLSVLHKAGKIARLVERRDACSIYVHPFHIGVRETAEHGSTAAGREHKAIAELREYLDINGHLMFTHDIRRILNENGV